MRFRRRRSARRDGRLLARRLRGVAIASLYSEINAAFGNLALLYVNDYNYRLALRQAKRLVILYFYNVCKDSMNDYILFLFLSILFILTYVTIRKKVSVLNSLKGLNTLQNDVK